MITIGIVALVSVVLLAIVLTIQGLTLLSLRLASSNVGVQTSFYAAEGLIFDALARMDGSYNGTGYSWPPGVNGCTPGDLNSSCNDSPPGPNDTEIKRNVGYDPVSGEYVIDVTASLPEATRRLKAMIKVPSGNFTPIDIMLVVDVSGSMQFGGYKKCADWNASEDPDPFTSDDCIAIGNNKFIGQPIYAAQSAAEYMINLIINGEMGIERDKVFTGLVTYSNKGELKKPLDNNHEATAQFLQGLHAEGGTNIHHALELARSELIASTNAGSRQAIVLLTDGLPNRYNNGTNPKTVCTNGGALYGLPTGPGNDTNCSNAVRDLAEIIKTNDLILIYNIGLGLKVRHGYMTQGHIDFSHEFLSSIGSYPPSTFTTFLDTRDKWDSPNELQYLFADILSHIISEPYLRIIEVPPGV